MAEEELYSQRAKLFCFRDNDWRERGLGDAKLLKHPEMGVRFLMTQERTGRIIANHLVVEHSTYCDLRSNAGSDKCWVWSAQDCSDEELKTEQFALKFGSKELARAFQVAFDEAKVTNTAMGVPAREEAQETAASASPFASLAGRSPFSPANGPFAAPLASPFSSGSGGLFSSSSSGGGLFGTGSLFGSMSFVNGGSTSGSPALATGGLFGSYGSSQASATGGSFFGDLGRSQAASSGGSGGGLFGSYGSTAGGQAGTGGLFAPTTGGLFGGLGGQTGGLAAGTGSLFGGFSSGSGLFTAAATGTSAAAAAQGDDDAEEEVTTVPGWAPEVTLPVLEKVVTGEEEEDELYSQRSKLLRFRDGEWKERGLGEAKLLQHRQSKMVRFFMRQERTGKIVANHFVVEVGNCCTLRPNAGNPKCLVWMAQDFADEEPAVEQFALKFGTAELATDFKEAFGRAKELNAKNKGAAGKNAEPAPAAAKEETSTAAEGNASAAESAADSSAAGGSAAAKEAPEMYKLLMQLQRKVEEQEASHKLEIAELNAAWEAKFEELQRGSGQELALAERDRAKEQVCSLLSNLQENFEGMMAQVSQVQREVSGSGPPCLTDAPASSSARTVHSLEKKVETLCSLLSTLAEELRSTDERLAGRLAEQRAAAGREVAQLRDSLSPELAALLKRVSTLQRSFRREVDDWEPKVDGKLDLFRQEVRGESAVALAAIKRQLLSVARRVEELELAGGLDDA